MQLRRNSTLDLVGQSVPLLAALVAIPTIVSNLGESRFGAVTLVWAMAAYLGIFDLGIGRAITTRLAEELPRASDGREKLIALSGLGILAVSGIFFSLLLYWIAPPISAWVAADDAAKASSCKANNLSCNGLSASSIAPSSRLRCMVNARAEFPINSSICACIENAEINLALRRSRDA